MEENREQRRSPEAAGVALSREQIAEYTHSLLERGCVGGSVKKYAHDLLALYRFLPQGKEIGPSTLARWRDALAEQGYAPRTINTCISAANSFLAWLGCREYQLAGQLTVDDIQPELTRDEYLRLLSAARLLGKERTYLMVKVFAGMDLSVQELPQLTVEGAAQNRLAVVTGGRERLVTIPRCLREELLNYAREEHIASGPIFITRRGKQINRTAVTACIQYLSQSAQVEAEKCTPRCLHRLYQTTVADIEAGMRSLVEQEHERLLEQEQRLSGWS